MDQKSQDIISSVLYDALESYAPYGSETFARAAANIPDHIGRVPKQAGERAHTKIISKDVEDGLVSDAEGRALAHTNRKSIMDAFEILFPPEKLQEYLNHQLDNFSLLDDGVREIDSTALMPEILPSEYGNKSHEDGRRGSPMHITRKFGAEANGNFSNADLIRGYGFLESNPQYGLAIRWLTGTVTDYAIEMKDQIERDPRFANLKASGLPETLSLFGHEEALALMDGRLLVSTATMLSKSGPDPSYDDIAAAISDLNKPNVFKRPRSTPEGKGFVGMCPATRFNIGLLKYDLGSENAPKDLALSRFLDKIDRVVEGTDPSVTDEDQEKVIEQISAFKQTMSQILGTPEAQEAAKEWDYDLK